MPASDLDPQIQAFIDKTNEHYIEEISESDIGTQRKCYNAVCKTFARPYPPNITSRDAAIDNDGYNLKIRTYKHNHSGNNQHSEVGILYFHGGGFILGDLESHDSICAEICDYTHFDVISVDYRLAPEFQYPNDLHDALAAFKFAADRHPKVIVAGDSAGANLAAAICISLRGIWPYPIGQLLIYAGLGGSELNLESYLTHANAPMLTTKSALYYKAMRTGNKPEPKEPLFYPLLLDDFSALPTCYAISADIDPLRDDSDAYVQKLKQAGVTATWVNEPGLVHGYLRARHCSDKARASFKRTCQAFPQLVKDHEVNH